MNKFIFIILLIIVGGFYYQSNQDEVSEGVINSKPGKSGDILVGTTQNKAQISKAKEHNPFTVLAKMDLYDQWEDEYGCFDFEQTDSSCSEYPFLSARSLEEAEWMRRQGFPSKSLIEMAKDPSKQEEFQSLLDKKSPAAHTVATLLSLEAKDIDRASTMALKNKYFSDDSKSYPYRLYGEVLLAQGEKVSAISQFQMAALLGDSQANAIVHGIAAGDAIFVSHAMNRAYESLNSMFDVIPKDPRPEGFGGG